MTSRGANSGSSQLSRRNGAIPGWLADRATLTTVIGAGAIVGAVAGAATARGSQSEDVISGTVSIDLLKKVELLTVRLRLHRS
jgi:stage V sporulation protein SpoVS